MILPRVFAVVAIGPKLTAAESLALKLPFAVEQNGLGGMALPEIRVVAHLHLIAGRGGCPDL